MVDQTSSDAISVIVDRNSDNSATVARFEWSISQPEDTYTIDVTKQLSLELDRHFPVRPKTMREYDSDDDNDIEMLRDLFGEDLVEAVLDAQRLGGSMLQIVLSPDNRRRLAQVQLESPSTPSSIRQACEQILANTKSHDHKV